MIPYRANDYIAYCRARNLVQEAEAAREMAQTLLHYMLYWSDEEYYRSQTSEQIEDCKKAVAAEKFAANELMYQAGRLQSAMQDYALRGPLVRCVES